MNKKTITKTEFEEIKSQYEAAIRARAYTIKAMKEEGKTYQEIAEFFGIRRQAVQKIYKDTSPRLKVERASANARPGS